MLRFLAGVVLTASLALGQTSTQILGTIADSSGAAVGNATIEAVRKGTGEKRTAASNDTGNYVLLNLESGEYEVTVSAPGFRTERISSLVLEINQRARVDMSLQVGNVTESIQAVS